MATYKELFDLRTDSDLQDRISAAVAIAADTISKELDTVGNHANRLIWAREAMAEPMSKRDGMIAAVLAANKSVTVEQVTGSTDAALQATVDATVDLFAQG